MLRLEPQFFQLGEHFDIIFVGKVGQNRLSHGLANVGEFQKIFLGRVLKLVNTAETVC